ncbi:MAG: hypothetical protein IKU05_01650 [Bacteroidales bacterium]|nr:hypothetical protein [Bacteroidales bacterium]
MKNISLFNKTIIALLIAAIFFSTSCRKQEAPIVPQPVQQAGQTPEKGLVITLAIIAAVTIAVIEVTEGHYHKEVITNPDGTQTTREWCEGFFGHCSIHARATGLPSNPTGLISISSVGNGKDFDYTGSCKLARTEDNKIVLLAPNDPTNRDFNKNFFYDETINITKPLIIDNPDVLKLLNRGHLRAIKVEGTYEVYESTEGKFIVID